MQNHSKIKSDLADFGLKSYSFIAKLQSIPTIEAIYIYGSRARGDFDEWSDVDLAILCPNASDEDRFLINDILENADILVDVQYVEIDKIADPVFMNQVNKYKKEIYHA
ncbi:MAG: nucleotidyltransferase domain-containing protein [Pseudomonadota bacterium]